MLRLLACVGALIAAMAPARADVTLSVDDAIATALERRAEITEADVELERARLRELGAKLAWTELRVDVRAAAGYERGNAEEFATTARCATSGVGCPPTVYQVEADAGLTVPVWSGLRLESTLAAARLRRSAAGQRQRATENEVALDVARAFWAVRGAELTRDLVLGELERARELERLTQQEAAAGIVPGFDSNRARAQALSVELELRRIERALAAGRAQLGLALELDEPLRLAGDPRELPAEVPALAEAERQALRAHPELAAVRADEQASARELTAAKGAYWPQLALVARAGIGAGTPSLGINGTERAWGGMFAGAQLSWPVFDMLSTWLQVREAGLAHDRAEALRDRERARVLAEVRTAHGELERTAAAMPAIREAVALARANVDIARRRYLAGTTRLSELLDIQRELRALEEDWIATAVVVAETSMRLRVAMGRR